MYDINNISKADVRWNRKAWIKYSNFICQTLKFLCYIMFTCAESELHAELLCLLLLLKTFAFPGSVGETLFSFFFLLLLPFLVA